jgi:hypothetical protein
MISEKEEENARDMFVMPGWQDLMDQIEDQIELCNLDACDSAEDLWFNKGRLAVLRMFANYEQYVRSVGEQDEADRLQ